MSLGWEASDSLEENKRKSFKYKSPTNNSQTPHSPFAKSNTISYPFTTNKPILKERLEDFKSEKFSPSNKFFSPNLILPSQEMNEKTHRLNYEQLIDKSWNDVSSFIIADPIPNDRSPLEIGYLRYKNGEAANSKPKDTFWFYESTMYSQPVHSEMFKRSKFISGESQAQKISSLQQVYKNILVDFNNLKSQLQSSASLQHQEFRASGAIFEESKLLSNAKRIINPHQGGSRLNYWK